MNELKGWVKLHRSMMDWEWYDDINTKVVFIHLLLNANLEPKRYRGYEVPAGGVVIGINALSEALDLSPRKVRTALDKLEQTGEIKRKATNKFTVITIEKWSFYQDRPDHSDKQTTNKRQTNDIQMTNKRHSNDIQATTPKEYKNIRIKEYKNKEEIKKDNNNSNYNKRPYGTYTNVYLTDDEFDKFIKTYPDWKNKIDYLSNYLKSTGKNYKSHYATLTKWAKEDEAVNETKRNQSNERGTGEVRRDKSDWGEYAGWFAD